MYHAESNTPASARTSNLNEELGQVSSYLINEVSDIFYYHFFFLVLAFPITLVCTTEFMIASIYTPTLFRWNIYFLIKLEL